MKKMSRLKTEKRCLKLIGTTVRMRHFSFLIRTCIADIRMNPKGINSKTTKPKKKLKKKLNENKKS